MPQFRKKPVIIEAHLVTEENLEEVAEWCGGSVVEGVVVVPNVLSATARLDEYVVRRTTGKFDVVPKDEFEEEYYKVDD